MKGKGVAAWVGVVCLLLCSWRLQAQQADSGSGTSNVTGASAASQTTGTVVPRLVQFSGVINPQITQITQTPGSADAEAGSARVIVVTFSLYQEQEGGTPLWSETERVTLDEQGHYTVLLGASSPEGLPLDLFASGAARWLGVQPALPGVGELPRVLLVGVPYALKAADADTLGGRPASAFVTTDAVAPVAPPFRAAGAGLKPGAMPGATDAAGSKAGSTKDEANSKSTNSTTITGGGTANYVPLWTGSGASTTLGNSALYQSGSNIGIGTTTPVTPLEANGVIYTMGAAGGFQFAMRDSTVTSQWYGKGNVSRFWRSDIGDVMGVTSTGSVGIGTTSPSTLLQVNGSSPIYSTGTGAGLEFQMRDGTVASQWYGKGNVSRFWRSDKGDIIGVTSAGNVGIGTTAPAAKLEVNGTSKFDQAVTFASGQTFPGAATLGSNTFVGNQTINGEAVVTDDASGSAGVFTSDSDGSSGVEGTGGGGSNFLGSLGGLGLSGVGGYEPKGTGGAGVQGYAGSGFGLGGPGGYFIGGNSSGTPGTGGDGVVALAGAGSGGGLDGFAGSFQGDVDITGTLTKGGGSFKIDDPLDPANKYLYHSFVESPDMKNIYDGIATLDGSGDAVVELPAWFGLLNKDFRYQLTPIGAPGPNLYIAREIANNQFIIAGGSPGMRVSWQVTGTRQDAWANAHRIPVEVEKAGRERGYYLHPELYGAPETKGIMWARHPELMQRMKELREKQANLTAEKQTQ